MGDCARPMSARNTDPDEQQAIVALVAAREAAWNAGDTVAYAQLLTEDADIVSATGRPARGSDALLKLFAEQHGEMERIWKHLAD